MLADAFRILNFDASVSKQKKLLEHYRPAVVDLEGIGVLARLWLNQKTEKEIKRSLAPELKNAPTFFGSGDFHHISSLLIEQFQEPLSVIIFDHHPDWNVLPPRMGCGSWISRILEKTNIKKVILIGVASDDISAFSIQTGNLAALKDGRLEIYPYFHEPTTVFFRKVWQNRSIRPEKNLFFSTIHWQELKGKNLAQFLLELIARLEAKQAYVSIDKDCLKGAYALTNWEEGGLTLDELLAGLKIIKQNLEIVGLDICGDYSPVNIKGRIKAICSFFDHPKEYTAKNKPVSLVNAVNEATNIAIAQLLNKPLREALRRDIISH